MERKLIAEFEDGDVFFELISEDGTVCCGSDLGNCNNSPCFAVAFSLHTGGTKTVQFYPSCISCELRFWDKNAVRYEQVVDVLKKYIKQHPETGLEI